ncbi:MAG: hypothetical protein M1816_003511 [Peltula sp. TS41687]|nr:MAG: hypothetical protein M1816_003511 [Peltula sp. TS41687]
MKLVRVPFAVVAFFTISVSFHLPPSRSSDRNPERISLHPNSWKDHGKSGFDNDSKVDDQRNHPRRQRRSSIPPPPPPSRDELSPWEKRMNSPDPTMKEMGWVLSPGEVEAYIEHRRAGKEYKAALYRKDRGEVLSPEEEKQLEAEKLGYNEARRLEEHVKAVLVKQKRARAELVESYEKRLRSARQSAAKQYSNTKARMKELKDLFDNDLASPDEVAEYEKRLSQAQERTERSLEASARRRTEFDARMKELEELDNPTDAERAEYKSMVAKREKELARQKDYTKTWRAEKETTYNKRIEELEPRIRDQVATPAEVTEYQELVRGREEEVERQREYNQNWYVENRAYSKRIEELEPRIRQEVATPAERAEYDILLARREEKRESNQRRGDRKRTDKDRMQELERRISDRLASPAEQAEYNDLSAKFQKLNKPRKTRTTEFQDRLKELERITYEDPTDAEIAEYEAMSAKLQADRDNAAEGSRKSRKKKQDRLVELEMLDDPTPAESAELKAIKADIQTQKDKKRDADAKQGREKRAKKKAEKAGGTPSTETGSKKADQNNAGQPLQSTTNLLRQKVDSFLNRLGGLLPKTPTGTLPPVLQVLPPPMPVPL